MQLAHGNSLEFGISKSRKILMAFRQDLGTLSSWRHWLALSAGCPKVAAPQITNTWNNSMYPKRVAVSDHYDELSHPASERQHFEAFSSVYRETWLRPNGV